MDYNTSLSMSMAEGAYQGELFPEETPGHRRSKPRPRALFPLRRVTLTIACEQLVIGLIVLLMLMVVTHSLGVERGRRLALTGQRAAAPQSPRAVPATTGAPASERGAAASPAVTTGAPAPRSAAQPVQAATKPIAATTIPSGSGAYTIQLVTYSRPALAQRELAKLRREGQEPFLVFDGKYFFVCIGGFGSTSEAARYLPALRKRYPDSFVRKR